ncbi:uncharacterized protein LOC130957173 [Arachis stenosperma]|uniref:uncharacterized protein LOC130957173 n=1 Tax=Arachis stenosperma TaxID=217475 RepID=UPI0025ABAE0B|nr:uncharacterized protein LOC130957173 [Arachis stenosperma]
MPPPPYHPRPLLSSSFFLSSPSPPLPTAATAPPLRHPPAAPLLLSLTLIPPLRRHRDAVSRHRAKRYRSHLLPRSTPPAYQEETHQQAATEQATPHQEVMPQIEAADPEIPIQSAPPLQQPDSQPTTTETPAAIPTIDDTPSHPA